jgi:hypothetical protein
LYRRASEGRAEGLHHRSASLAVIAQNPDLDQLMRGQCPIGLGNDPRRQAGITDHHHRVEVMGVGAQRTPCGGVQRGDSPRDSRLGDIWQIRFREVGRCGA